jgi:hypothetical protein
MKKIEVLIFVLFAFFPLTLKAQFSVKADLILKADNNINNNYEQINDEIFEAKLKLGSGIIPGFKKLKMFYDGSFNYYKRNIEHTFHEHTAGIEYSSSLGCKRETDLDIGAVYSITQNRSDYSYLDNSSIHAYGNISHYLSKKIIGMIDYEFSYNMFSEYNDFNNFQNHLSANAAGFLSSKTTLGVELKGGIKSYLNALNTGNGKNKKGSSGNKGTSVVRIDASGNFNYELFDKTNLYFESGLNKNFNSNGRYITSGNKSGMENTFDDEFSNEGLYVSMLLSSRLPWNVYFLMNLDYRNMNFTNRPAYDLNENIINDERIDKSTSLSVDITKYFKSFEVKLSYQYINNNSNDLYYNSHNNIYSFQISSGF